MWALAQAPGLTRWGALSASVLLEANAGLQYVFGDVSGALRTRLGYSQRQIDGLGTAKVRVVSGKDVCELPVCVNAAQRACAGLWNSAGGCPCRFHVRRLWRAHDADFHSGARYFRRRTCSAVLECLTNLLRG